MNALGEGVQSLWYSHAHEETEECEEGLGSISGIKCKGGRLKNGELVVAVARYMINEHSATAETMSEYFSVTTRSVNVALKKIRDRLDAGLAIPGLSGTETESVFRALVARDRYRIEARAGKREAEALRNRLIGIMREHVVCRMFKEGYRIADIAGAIGINKKKVRQVIERVHNISDSIVEMYREGKSIQQISELLNVPKREIQNSLKAAGYNLKTLKQFTCIESDRRRAGTIKPAKPRSKRTPVRRAATINREGLADWNRLNYDDSGRLRLPSDGISRPSQVSSEHLKEYLAALRPTNQTVSLNNKIRAIKAFFTYLHREGYVVRNPAADLRQFKATEKAVPCFSRNSLKVFFPGRM